MNNKPNNQSAQEVEKLAEEYAIQYGQPVPFWANQNDLKNAVTYGYNQALQSKAVGYSLEQVKTAYFTTPHQFRKIETEDEQFNRFIQSLTSTPIQTKGREVEFAEWIKDNKWQSFLLDSWIKYDGNGNTVGIEKTTSSLFQLFLTTNPSNKGA